MLELNFFAFLRHYIDLPYDLYCHRFKALYENEINLPISVRQIKKPCANRTSFFEL